MIDRNFVLNQANKSGDINEYVMSLYNIPVQANAKTIVEIGSGVSTFALIAAANKTGGHVTSIDIGGLDTLRRQDNGLETIKDEPNFTMLTGSSLEVSWEKPIDFFFLDSEHTLELSRKEIARWFPKVIAGGIIMLHDTGHESEDKKGARIALDEYLALHPDEYTVIHLMDTKIIGMSVLVKLKGI